MAGAVAGILKAGWGRGVRGVTLNAMGAALAAMIVWRVGAHRYRDTKKGAWGYHAPC